MLKIFPKFKATLYEIKKKIDDNKIEILFLVV